MVLVMLCWSYLFDFHSTVDEKPNKDLTQSFSDKSSGLLQTCHSTEQFVFSSECIRVDTGNQRDTAENCQEFDTACDDQVLVENGKHTCEVCSNPKTHMHSLRQEVYKVI